METKKNYTDLSKFCVVAELDPDKQNWQSTVVKVSFKLKNLGSLFFFLLPAILWNYKNFVKQIAQVCICE